MIIDSHCHCWAHWPYQPPVPDPESRAIVPQLLMEMETNGVERAIVICAGISGNPDNNDYVTAEAAKAGGRLIPFIDVDSRWSETHHAPGAGDRLEAACERWQPRGFTHYLNEDDPLAAEWLLTGDGRAFFEVVRRRGLIASIACAPWHLPGLSVLADAFPEVPILLHHLALFGPKARDNPEALAQVLAIAKHPNMYVKVSGYGNVSDREHEYPYPGVRWIVRALYDAIGPWRLLWGSDYPVSRRYMTYRQTLDMVRRHNDGIPDADVQIILGAAAGRLIG